MLLVCLDFDWTVVEENSDTWVIERLPGAKPAFDAGEGQLPWTQLIDASLRAAAAAGATAADVHRAVRSIELHPSVAAALRALAGAGAEVIVLSDANTVFIEEVLAEHGLRDCVAEVYSNPAAYDEAGALRVEPHHTGHGCGAGCPPNLCKSQVLLGHLSEREAAGRRYSAIAYAGDGGGDLCPSLTLLTREPAAAARVRVLARSHYPGGQPCRLWAGLQGQGGGGPPEGVRPWSSPGALAALLTQLAEGREEGAAEEEVKTPG